MNAAPRRSARKRTGPPNRGLVVRLRLRELLGDEVQKNANQQLQLAEMARAQRDLESSRERYASLFDFAPVGYANLDRAGCFTNINLEGARLLNRKRRQLLGKSLLPLIVPADRRQWLNHLTRMRTGHERSSVELRLATGNEAPLVIRFYSVSSKPSGPDAKLELAFPTAMVDVTAQHLAEASVRRSEARFRALIEHAADTVFILDETGTIRYQSPNVVAMLGYPAPELEGRKVFELLEREDVAEARKVLAQVLAGPGQLQQVVARVRHKAGDWRWLQIIGKNLLNDPAVGGLVLTCRDITEARCAAAALELASRLPLENPSPVLRLEGGRTVSFANPAAQAVLEKWGTTVGGPAPAEIARICSAALAEGTKRETEWRQNGCVYAVVVVPVPSGRYVNLYFKDVTARARAEATLRRKEAQLRLITGNTAVMLAQCSSDLRYLFVNQAYADQLSLPPEQIIGRPMREVLGEAAFETVLPYIRLVLAGEPVEYDAEIPYPKAGSRFCHVTYQPERDEDGKVVGWFAGITDITERRRTEQALQESEARFRTMADGAPVLIWISGPDRLCTWFNKPWLEFTGRTLEQELGSGWADNAHPDDLDGCMKTYARAFDARQAFEMEYRLKRHDGEWRWVLDRGTPLFSPDRKFAGYIGSCVDITDRKNVEQEIRYQLQLLQNITAKAASSIFMTDQQHCITFANPEAERTFGYTAREMLGQPLHKILRRRFVGELPYPDGETPLQDIKRTRKQIRDHQEIFLRKNNSVVAVKCSSAVLEVEGRRVGAVYMLRDVTEQVRHEETLRRAHEELEARVVQRTEQLARAHELLQKQMAERAQLQEQILAAGEIERARVAQDLHDGLCQLLLGIRFKLELLRGRLEKRSQPGVKRLRALAQLLDRATEEARSLARGLHPVEAVPEGLRNALSELADSTRRMFRVNCQCDVPSDFELPDPAAANQLFRIAQEAVTNAIKHGKATRIAIRVTEDKQQLVLTITNNGSPVKPRSGPGLGRRTMDYRANQIGAEIELESKPGAEVTLRCVRPWPGKAAPAKRAIRGTKGFKSRSARPQVAG